MKALVFYALYTLILPGLLGIYGINPDYRSNVDSNPFTDNFPVHYDEDNYSMIYTAEVDQNELAVNPFDTEAGINSGTGLTPIGYIKNFGNMCIALLTFQVTTGDLFIDAIIYITWTVPFYILVIFSLVRMFT